MKTIQYYLLSFLILMCISNCNNEKKGSVVNELIASDIPKFINLLPTLSHDNMQLAFQQINSILKYKVRRPSGTYISFEASSEPRKGKKFIDGEITLYAIKLLQPSDQNEFAITLTAYPPLKDSVFFYTVKKLMNNYKKIDLDGGSAWQVNDWVLQIKGLSSVSYFPIADDQKIF